MSQLPVVKHRDYVEGCCLKVECDYEMYEFNDHCGAFACRGCGTRDWNVHYYTDDYLNLNY
jgi:hypothetical protein